MSEMNQLLGDVFNTAPAQHTPEDLAKEASYKFFSDLCDAEGIKLAELSNDQVERLYNAAMEAKTAAEEKGAEFPPPKAEKKDDEKPKDEDKSEEKEAEAKTEAALAEFQEKRAAAAKVAEAKAMGEIMAHSFMAELRKTAEAGGGFPFPPKGGDDEKKDEKSKDEKKDGKDEGKEKESSAQKAERLTAWFSEQTKSASSMPNFDELAGSKAIDLLKEAGVNEELATARINAVHTLGVPDSTKVASIAEPAIALHVRALEYCEAAGFPVDWSQA